MSALRLLITCPECERALPRSAFAARYVTCRECINGHRRTWRRTNGDAARAGDAAAYQTKKTRALQSDPVKWLWKVARNRARQFDIKFTIKPSDLFLPRHCPVLGLLLLPPGAMRKGADRDRIPSVDRIIPSRGYVPGNVAVISLRANRLKNDATPEELQRLARWVTAHAEKRRK